MEENFPIKGKVVFEYELWKIFMSFTAIIMLNIL